MRISLLTIALFFLLSVKAQKVDQLIQKGNENYKLKEYSKADEEYMKALKNDSKNPLAQFNSGNAKHRLNRYEEAAKAYDNASQSSTDPIIQSRAHYNQGLSFIKQKKLPDAIDAFKKSLRLNSSDSDARENLQKALNELKRQQQQQDQKDDKNKKKQDQKPKQENNKSKLSKEKAEKLLNDLQKEEKSVQKQMQKKPQSARQLKDW